jgi:cell wall-associated NlpC family hydrolase
VSWPYKYVGLKWVAYATGPDEFDCWGLVHHCLNEYFGVVVNRFEDVRTDDKASINMAAWTTIGHGDWVKCEVPQDGDVVLMSRKSVFHHVGIHVDGKVLHSRDGSDACIERERDLRLIGFKRIEYFRHVSLIKSI